MSSTQLRQDAQRAVSQMEPQVETKVSRERVETIANRNPEHDLVRMHQNVMQEAAQRRAAYRAAIDKLVTLERGILIMDAAGAFVG